MINILIGGDICPVRRNLSLFKRGDAQHIFNDLLVEFEKADLSLVNLECPLIIKSTPIKKSGPVLGVDRDCINGLKAAHIDVVNLSNNHIFDHGPEGLRVTMEACAESGISTVGAGKDITEAGKILIREVKGIRIGIMGVAEHEFSIANDNKPGANPLDLIKYVRTIQKHKQDIDYLIVLVHSGANGHPLPSPQLLEICRFMVEMGADTVVCQHSHCPGSYEKYNGSYIVYGQGNLIFDLDGNPNQEWKRGFLVDIKLEGNINSALNLIPYIQSDENPGAKRMSYDEESIFLSEIQMRSSRVYDSSYIHQQWIKYCKEQRDSYYFNLLLGFTSIKKLRYLHRMFPIARFFFTKRHRQLLHNLIRCETHRNALETILERDD